MPKPLAVTMSGTATYTLRSRALPDALRIDVSMPNEYDSTAACYPVVYLIDGNWFFPIVSHAVRQLEVAAELPPVIVVGVGYEPTGLPRLQEEDRLRDLRCRDLTPTRDPSEWWLRAPGGRALGPGIETGHAEEFLGVIEEEVKPLVREHHRADSANETLAGFSLGGLFALYTLFRHTDLFDRYIAGSPSLWWDRGALFGIEAQYAATHRDLDKSVFVSIGELEESGAHSWAEMVSNVGRFSERLTARNYPSLNYRSMVLASETHATGIAPTFVKGLLCVFHRSP